MTKPRKFTPKSPAYINGLLANEKRRLMNPYTYGTQDYEDWEAGWEDGRLERLEKKHECVFKPAIDLRTLKGWAECECGKKQLRGATYYPPEDKT